MKRSRLKLFKTTSLTISIIGVLLILLTVGLIGYVAVSGLSNSVSTTVSSGSSYDQLDQVKTQYEEINNKYENLNKKLGTNPDPNIKTTFNTGKVKLSEISQSISSIQNDSPQFLHVNFDPSHSHRLFIVNFFPSYSYSTSALSPLT